MAIPKRYIDKEKVTIINYQELAPKQSTICQKHEQDCHAHYTIGVGCKGI